MIQLEQQRSGPLGLLSFKVKNTDNGRELEVGGREASLLALLLSGYTLKTAVHPLELFEAMNEVSSQ